MIPVSLVILTSLLYFGVLFGVAFYADRQRKRGRSVIDNAAVYSLSLWRFIAHPGHFTAVLDVQQRPGSISLPSISARP